MTPQANNADDDTVIWYDGKSYTIDENAMYGYLFRTEGKLMIAYKTECARSDHGTLIAIEAHTDTTWFERHPPSIDKGRRFS